MYKIIFVLLYILNTTVYAKYYNKEQVYVIDNIWYDKQNNQKATGFVSDDPSDYSCKFTLENGLKEGPDICLLNGNEYTRTEYKNGLKHGSDYSYYRDSEKIQNHKKYADGKKHGRQYFFFKSGNLLQYVNCNNGDCTDGKGYYESGKIAANFYLSNEGETRKITLYYKNGNKKSEILLDRRKQDLDLITYNSDGTKEYSIKGKNGDPIEGYKFHGDKKTVLNIAQMINLLQSGNKYWGKAENNRIYP